jgi:hypothetical protein
LLRILLVLQRGFLDEGGSFQKMILMTTEERLKEIRPLAIAALEDSATLTTALPGMLEVGDNTLLTASCGMSLRAMWLACMMMARPMGHLTLSPHHHPPGNCRPGR